MTTSRIGSTYIVGSSILALLGDSDSFGLNYRESCLSLYLNYARVDVYKVGGHTYVTLFLLKKYSALCTFVLISNDFLGSAVEVLWIFDESSIFAFSSLGDLMSLCLDEIVG